MMKVAVIGAGVMGSGIALCSIQAGYPTVLFDVNEAAIARGLKYIKEQLEIAVTKANAVVKMPRKASDYYLLRQTDPRWLPTLLLRRFWNNYPLRRNFFNF